MNKAKRSSAYVKAKDEKYGLKVVSRDLKTSQINGLNCLFCAIFGREAKVGSKRKPTNNVQAWHSPFRYDNIEAHLENQHPSKFSEYKKLETNEAWSHFFKDFINKYRNNMPSHFIPESIGQRAMVFEIGRDIVDVVVGEMFYFPDEDDEREDGDAVGNGAELCCCDWETDGKKAKAKERALIIL